MAHRVLVVDDEATHLKTISTALVNERMEVETAVSGKTALELLSERPFDAVVCDLKMPVINGMDVLGYAMTLPEPPAFLMLTGYGDLKDARLAGSLGACAFIGKPVNPVELAHELQGVLRDRPGIAGLPTLVGGEWLLDVEDRIARFAANRAPVLIKGEICTGKTLVARALCRAMSRPAAPFAVVHCGLDSWYRPDGSPWSAEGKASGFVVLDEIGRLPERWQLDLLQTLQRHESGDPVRELPRIVATTSDDLGADPDAESPSFNQRLLFRLSRQRIVLPPLRKRRDDIPRLAQHFVDVVTARKGLASKTFEAQAMARLRRQPWPGNVKQLENVVTMLCMARSGPVITEDHVRAEIGDDMPSGDDPDSGPPTDPEAKMREVMGRAKSFEEAMNNYESRLLSLAMAATDGNQSKAARLLELSRTTLASKLRRLGLHAAGRLED